MESGHVSASAAVEDKFVAEWRYELVLYCPVGAVPSYLRQVSEAVTLYATLLRLSCWFFLVNSFPPLFVFALGIALTLLFPRVAKESLGGMKLVQKCMGIN